VVPDKKVVPDKDECDDEEVDADKKASWQLVPLDLSIMLGGK
jgi:hypothetical protein